MDLATDLLRSISLEVDNYNVYHIYKEDNHSVGRNTNISFRGRPGLTYTYTKTIIYTGAAAVGVDSSSLVG